MTDNVNRFSDAIGTVKEAARTAEQLKSRILGEDAPDEKEAITRLPYLRTLLESGPDDVHFLAREIIECLKTIESLLFEYGNDDVHTEAKKSEFEKTSAPIRNA